MGWRLDLQGLEKARENPSHAFWTLGEYLELVMRSLRHHSEGLLQEPHGNAWVKEVRHAVYEDASRLSPPERLTEFVRVQSKPEAWAIGAVILVAGVPHRLEALRERCRVAMVAPGRDPPTPCRGVPGEVGPLDRGCAHPPGLYPAQVTFLRTGEPKLQPRGVAASPGGPLLVVAPQQGLYLVSCPFPQLPHGGSRSSASLR